MAVKNYVDFWVKGRKKNCKAPCFEAFMINDKIYKKNTRKPGKKKKLPLLKDLSCLIWFIIIFGDLFQRLQQQQRQHTKTALKKQMTKKDEVLVLFSMYVKIHL